MPEANKKTQRPSAKRGEEQVFTVFVKGTNKGARVILDGSPHQLAVALRATMKLSPDIKIALLYALKDHLQDEYVSNALQPHINATLAKIPD
jgi:hypothetical protein